jgi:hypothetical protein
MSTRPSTTGLSPLQKTGALSGALAILLGSIVLLGWMLHSPLLIQVTPNLAPMQRNTAVDFILSGTVLLGIVIAKPRLILIGSAITAALSAVSLLEYLSHANFGIDELLGVAFITTHSPTTVACRQPLPSVSWFSPLELCWPKTAASASDPRCWE